MLVGAILLVPELVRTLEPPIRDDELVDVVMNDEATDDVALVVIDVSLADVLLVDEVALALLSLVVLLDVDDLDDIVGILEGLKMLEEVTTVIVVTVAEGMVVVVVTVYVR